MPEKKSADNGTETPGSSAMRRRDFLRFGALGIAAGSLPGRAATGEEPAVGSPSEVGAGMLQEATQLPPGWIDPTSVPVETWQEPLVWRPDDWPGDSLHLNVIKPHNPGLSTSPGNRRPSLYSYGGTSPGPTIRVRGDGVIRVKVRNLMGLDHGRTPVGPWPDPLELPPPQTEQLCRLIAEERGTRPDEEPTCRFPIEPIFFPEVMYRMVGVKTVPGHAVNNHANGFHSAHVTNVHTHGLHVHPVSNPDGSHSDNPFLRILNHADWAARQREEDPVFRRLGSNERVGDIDYEFRLGDVMPAGDGSDGQGPMPHPPGTHWYHPHCHGSTNDQVLSGMAGFLIVEGDVDDAINRVMTGMERPDPEMKTGPLDYRERLLLLQHVELFAIDFNENPRRQERRTPPQAAIGGPKRPTVMFMRPGAVERWRVINGSVDGRGFRRFMVLDGEFVYLRNADQPGNRLGQLYRVERNPEGGEPKLSPVSRQEIEDAKLPLYQLSTDGITHVVVENGKARYTIDDLSTRNAGTQHPLAKPIDPEKPLEGLLRNLEDCFRDGDAIRHAFVRPNEVYMATANRADVFFKAPVDAAGRVYTVFAQEVQLHNDNFQGRIQVSLASGDQRFNPSPIDDIIAYVHVRGDAVEGGDFDVMSLRDALPDVPPFLQPIEEDELRVPKREAERRGVPEGSLRTRVVSYSGWGGADFPLVEVPQEFAEAHPELENLVWAAFDGTRVLIPNGTRTMGINPRFDLAANPDPPAPRKFDHHDPHRPMVGVDTAEEWALYNTSITVWAQTDTETHPQRGQYGLHYRSYPLSRAEGQKRHAADPKFRMTAKAVDHPFHIHVNPMWVMRIEVPDENGHLHNILDAPRWMDTVWIPRQGGRVVFRSRFPTFVGRWVNHCHVLAHEDNGMMQVVESTPDVGLADYAPRKQAASFGATEQEVNAVYPRPSLELCYKQNLAFVDSSPHTGQVYPGFDVDVPQIDEA